VRENHPIPGSGRKMSNRGATPTFESALLGMLISSLFFNMLKG
jgi:hypothetical protein